MFETTLVKGAKENLALLGKSGILKDDYLSGGTAVALQLGHRVSVDFDFFTPKKFDRKYEKLASNLVHLQKSLVFFDDAEVDEMPRMLKETKWKEVKSYFEHEVRKLAI